MKEFAQKLTYNGPKDFDLQAGLTLLFGVLGAISVLVIALAGLRMIIGSGNPESIAKAKNTIIYACIGLAICVSAMAVVQLVTRLVS